MCPIRSHWSGFSPLETALCRSPLFHFRYIAHPPKLNHRTIRTQLCQPRRQLPEGMSPVSAPAQGTCAARRYTASGPHRCPLRFGSSTGCQPVHPLSLIPVLLYSSPEPSHHRDIRTPKLIFLCLTVPPPHHNLLTEVPTGNSAPPPSRLSPLTAHHSFCLPAVPARHTRLCLFSAHSVLPGTVRLFLHRQKARAKRLGLFIRFYAVCFLQVSQSIS